LSKGPIEVVIVGDVSLDEAITQTARTFGALPARPPALEVPAERRDVRFAEPTREPVVRTHKGRADQAYAFTAWPTADFPSDPQRARTVRLLEQVLQLRLTHELREGQALTYSPQTDYEAAWAWPGYGYVGVAVEAPPDKLAAFDTAVERIVADLQAQPVSADELERARAPRIEQIRKAQATNEYWLSVLAQGHADPRRLEAIRTSVTGLERVTAADIQAVARNYLRADRAFRMRVVPEAKPET
jgi:zinc protease